MVTAIRYLTIKALLTRLGFHLVETDEGLAWESPPTPDEVFEAIQRCVGEK